MKDVDFLIAYMTLCSEKLFFVFMNDIKRTNYKFNGIPMKHVLNSVHPFQWTVGKIVLMAVSLNAAQLYLNLYLWSVKYGTGIHSLDLP